MKIGPIIHAIHRHNEQELNGSIGYRLIHTGQHYDEKMSGTFFKQLNIPEPDLNLEVGSGSQAYQTAEIMQRYEKALPDFDPDLCLVVGDVTSTMACAVVAKKSHMKVAHVEAGIRSGDRRMPEEINRLVTDSISDYYFTTSDLANANLRREGADDSQIFFVGNTMIDSLLSNLKRIKQPPLWSEKDLSRRQYLVMTLHRPSNVDDPENLARIFRVISDSVGSMRVVFPMHPRTRKVFSECQGDYPNIVIADPMPYLEFIYLIKNSAGVLTDSGGITEETTVLNIPCITLRDSTERPETVSMGTNELVGTNPAAMSPLLKRIKSGEWKQTTVPPLWDGKAAERIVNILASLSLD